MRHFFHGFIFTAIMVILLGAAWPLHAVTGDDIAPGMPCTIDKAVTMTANPSGIGGYILTCENNEWVATITAAPPTQPGQVATKSYIDDKIGTLSHEKWCRAEGSKIVCDQDNPSGGLPACAQGQTIVMGASGWECDVPSGGGGGSCWTQLTPPAQALYTPYILSDDGMTVALIDVNGTPIQISTNGGNSWDARGGNLDFRSIASSTDGQKLVAVAYGDKIYTSTNSGVSWTARDSNRVWVSVASSANGDRLIAAVNGGRLYTSTNSGASWTARESDRSWNNVFSSSNGSILYALDNGGGSGPARIFKSTNSGVSWSEISLPSEDDIVSLTSVSADGNKLILTTIDSSYTNPKIFISNNGGASWQQADNGESFMYIVANRNFDKFIGMSVNFLAGQISLYKGSNCLSF